MALQEDNIRICFCIRSARSGIKEQKHVKRLGPKFPGHTTAGPDTSMEVSSFFLFWGEVGISILSSFLTFIRSSPPILSFVCFSPPHFWLSFAFLPTRSLLSSLTTPSAPPTSKFSFASFSPFRISIRLSLFRFHLFFCFYSRFFSLAFFFFFSFPSFLSYSINMISLTLLPLTLSTPSWLFFVFRVISSNWHVEKVLYFHCSSLILRQYLESILIFSLVFLAAFLSFSHRLSLSLSLPPSLFLHHFSLLLFHLFFLSLLFSLCFLFLLFLPTPNITSSNIPLPPL
ncbi:unnamed protein product [Acanthosepion pharaonis]|uniref:Uncharacterized protein n=1 Tax=Acanthosepion pharaonis TaxID=158019 RepID=A0A812EN06_ACAPH|nr:unnamed protein product [Sepia pharaonis]